MCGYIQQCVRIYLHTEFELLAHAMPLQHAMCMTLVHARNAHDDIFAVATLQVRLRLKVLSRYVESAAALEDCVAYVGAERGGEEGEEREKK